MAQHGPVPPSVPWTSRPAPGSSRRPSQPALSSSIVKFTNAVYYPNWRVYRGETPASMNYNCISHVFYAFAHVDPDGGVFLHDEWADMQMPVDGSTRLGCIGSLIDLKDKHEHLRVLLSVGGGGAGSQHFSAVAASTLTRDNFARSVRGLIESAGFDGVDIDWEHPKNEEEGRNFLTLLATIRIHLPDERYLLSAALPAGEWALKYIDLNKAQDYLDFLNLMAYDFTGPWSQLSGHHAQLHPGEPGEPSGSGAVDYVLSTGFPASKILLGIPVYGRSFLGAWGPNNPYAGHGGNDGVFDYKELPRAGAEEAVVTAIAAAYCNGGDGGFVSYDTNWTVKIKAEYCREKRLGGLFYWTGTGDTPGPRSLIMSGYRALHDT